MERIGTNWNESERIGTNRIESNRIESNRIESMRLHNKKSMPNKRSQTNGRNKNCLRNPQDNTLGGRDNTRKGSWNSLENRVYEANGSEQRAIPGQQEHLERGYRRKRKREDLVTGLVDGVAGGLSPEQGPAQAFHGESPRGSDRVDEFRKIFGFDFCSASTRQKNAFA